MTNSRSLSWIDRGRWAGLLATAMEAITPPARRPAARPPARPAGPSRPIPPVPPQAPRPRKTTRPLPNARMLPAVPPLPAAPPPFVTASRSLEERLQALVTWIERSVPCRAAFIADDNGLPVVEHIGAEPGQFAAASSILVMLASLRSLMGDSGGWLSLKLGDAILHVVEIATPWGRFGIGVVTDDSLPREFLATLSAAVERAFHGEPSQGET